MFKINSNVTLFIYKLELLEVLFKNNTNGVCSTYLNCVLTHDISGSVLLK